MGGTAKEEGAVTNWNCKNELWSQWTDIERELSELQRVQSASVQRQCARSAAVGQTSADRLRTPANWWCSECEAREHVGRGAAQVPPTSRYLVSPRGCDDSARYFRPSSPADGHKRSREIYHDSWNGSARNDDATRAVRFTRAVSACR